MKIYYLFQTDNNNFDTYDSCVVCAENEQDAKTIHPDGREEPFIKRYGWDEAWAESVESVHCEEIGIAHDLQVRGVICASYNAG